MNEIVVELVCEHFCCGHSASSVSGSVSIDILKRQVTLEELMLAPVTFTVSELFKLEPKVIAPNRK